METQLKLPMVAAVATLSALSVVELWLRPIADPIPVVLAVHVVIFATLLMLPRAPATVVSLVLLEIFLVRHLGVLELIGMAGGLLTIFVATFCAAALVPTRRVLVIVAALALHFVWRATLPTASFEVLYQDAALFSVGVLAGAYLQRRHARLLEVRSERDRLVAALDTGPGAAATAEQLRTWSLLEQRIEPVLHALPGLVASARGAADLEAIRARASDALAEMQATIRVLGDPPPVPESPEPPRLRRSRSVPPLWVACALLFVTSVIEMLVPGEISYFAPMLALAPLLTPRAPITAAALVGIAAILCSLAGDIPIAARVADLAAITTIIVATTTTGPARATVAFVVVTAGLLISQGLDPTRDWPVIAFVGTACIYFGHWLFGLRLRGVVAEQRQIDGGLVEIAEALAELEARAARAERVRLARELHDLVGHALTAVAIQAGVAQAHLKRGREPDLAPLAVAAAQGADELRRLATILGHETGDPRSDLQTDVSTHPRSGSRALTADISAEFTRITDTARAAGQHVELELDHPTAELDSHVRHAVVCVAAEALTNAAKHASGATVHVKLKASDDRLELAVVDDGGDRHDLPSGGRGIDSMAQRVHACGGSFASGPRPGGGWTVRAVLPLSV